MVKLGEIKEGMGNVEVIARILSLRERKVTARGEEKLVYSGILGDKTGKAMYTAWKDFGLKENEVVKISNAYIKSWRGMPQLIFDERSTVEKLEDERLPSVQEIGGKEMQISNLVDKGGALDVVIEGTVLEIREGSGLIYRCPECNRAIKKGICRIHGEVDGKPDLRIKAVVDDGTGVVDALLNKGLTEKILGKKLDQCIQMAKEAMNHEIIKDELADKLIAKPLRLRGNAFSSDYGIRFMASEADVSLPNIEEGADDLLRELGG
jgi:replication factor A1